VVHLKFAENPVSDKMKCCWIFLTVLRMKIFLPKQSQGLAYHCGGFHNLCLLKRLQKLGMYVLAQLFLSMHNRVVEGLSALSTALGRIAPHGNPSAPCKLFVIFKFCCWTCSMFRCVKSLGLFLVCLMYLACDSNVCCCLMYSE